MSRHDAKLLRLLKRGGYRSTPRPQKVVDEGPVRHLKDVKYRRYDGVCICGEKVSWGLIADCGETVEKVCHRCGKTAVCVGGEVVKGT